MRIEIGSRPSHASRCGASALLVAVLAWPCVLGAVQAQPAGGLQIKVGDQTGRVIPGATVFVEGSDGGQYTPTTPAPGSYAVEGLPPGSYTIRITMDGFAPVTRQATVAAGRITEVSITLMLALKEELSVTERVVGRRRDSLTGLTLSGEEIEQLPNNPIELLFRLLDLAGSRGRPGDVAIYVDGFRDFRRLPPKAAIDAILINAEPFAAEFSEPGTRRIEIITKPGSDKAYGEVTSDFNDESLNSREPYAGNKPSLQRRSLSAYVGGPIVPQRWGFYAYAGRWEQSQNAVINATVLDANAEPAHLGSAVAAPRTEANVTVNTNFALSSRVRAKVEYAYDEERARNQGLESGLDLPERALRRTRFVDTGRASVMALLGGSTVLELRAQYAGERKISEAASSAPAVLVLDSFFGGGNQESLYVEHVSERGQVDLKLTWSAGRHTLKAGASLDPVRLKQVSRSDFGGTFIFAADVERDPRTGLPILGADLQPIPISPLETYRRTILRLPGYGPAVLSRTSGDSGASVRQYHGSAYIQDDWRPSDRFSLSVGVRHQRQTNVSHRTAYAPRLGFAWSPFGGQTLIRGGSGFFYSGVDPEIALETRRLDGLRQQRVLVLQPPSFPHVPETFDGALTVRPSRIVQSPGLKLPYQWISTIGIERPFGPLNASVSYTFEEGRELLRLRDLAGGTPEVGQVLQFDSIARAKRRELQVGARLNVGSAVHLLGNYTYAITESDTDGPGTLPADSRRLDLEWGPARGDERHRGFLTGTLTLPHTILIVPSVTLVSGRPFNITTGFDNNNDTQFTDRPALVDASDPDARVTPFGIFDLTPDPGEASISRNFGRQKGQIVVGLSVSKIFILGEPNTSKRALVLGASADNLFNRTNPGDFNGVLISPTFGLPLKALPARRVTLSMQVNF